MVSKRLFSAKTFQGKTPWKALSILFLLAVMILPSCSALTVSDSSDPTEIVVPKADTVSAIADFQPREIIELPPIADCFVVASYRQDLVTTHDDTQTLYLFDVHTQTSKALYTAAEGYYIKQTAANAEWIAWIETDYRLDSVGNMASAWKIMALNMLTGETKQVDQDANLSYSDNIPSFVGLAPKRIEISENNQLAYCKNSPYRDSASSEVVLADLNAGSKETVQRTDDVTSEWLYECSIFGDTIVWNKYSEPNDDFSFRMAQYKYSAIYSYDIPSKKTEALTGSQEFYDNPSLYENHLAMVKLPLTKPGQASSNAEIALMDLKTKSIEIVVDENSAIYLNKIDAAFPMTRSNPQITSRYITWWSTSDRARVYLYDYYQHTFVQMYDAPVNFDSTEIYRLFENAVILYETKLDDKGDSQSRTFYVSLE